MATPTALRINHNLRVVFITNYSKSSASGNVTYSKFSAGALHSCGITTSAVLKCWGSNQYGQLGDGSTNDRYVRIGISSVIK